MSLSVYVNVLRRRYARGWKVLCANKGVVISSYTKATAVLCVEGTVVFI